MINPQDAVHTTFTGNDVGVPESKAVVSRLVFPADARLTAPDRIDDKEILPAETPKSRAPEYEVFEMRASARSVVAPDEEIDAGLMVTLASPAELVRADKLLKVAIDPSMLSKTKRSITGLPLASFNSTLAE